MGGRVIARRGFGLVKTISFVLATLISRRLTLAQSQIAWYSASRPTSLHSGFKTVTSSANLIRALRAEMVVRSWMRMLNKVGPREEPWTTPLLMAALVELTPPSRTDWVLSLRKSIIQLLTAGGIGSLDNLDRRTLWSTVSKALLKSTSRHLTKLLFSNINVTLCMIVARAQVLLPDAL